jgi:hypothetical protein
MSKQKLPGAGIVRPLILKELWFGENRAPKLQKPQKERNEKNIARFNAFGRTIDL